MLFAMSDIFSGALSNVTAHLYKNTSACLTRHARLPPRMSAILLRLLFSFISVSLLHIRIHVIRDLLGNGDCRNNRLGTCDDITGCKYALHRRLAMIICLQSAALIQMERMVTVDQLAARYL